MKTKSMIVAIVLILSFMGCNAQNEKKDPNSEELTGAYFNEAFPSSTVSRFAPNVFTQELHAPPIFSTRWN